MEKDSRVLYNIGGYQYTVSDIEGIYQECKTNLDQYDKNNPEALYDLLQIEHKENKPQTIVEIRTILADRMALIATSGDLNSIKSEVRNCRRKFYYWNDLPLYFYFINEELDFNIAKSKFVSDIELDKKYYDIWIVYACYSILMNQGCVSDITFEDHKKYWRKMDWEYVDALKYFAGEFAISSNLEISTDEIFVEIYNRILMCDPTSFFTQISKELSKSYDNKEKRMQINNENHVELPTLINYAIRAWTRKSEGLEACNGNENLMCNESEFRKLLLDTRYAIRLLDVNNEYDMEFILADNESAYLKRIMNYSSVYDIHQYVPEGMLFLIKRIIDAHQEQLELFYECDAEELYDIICHFVRTAQSDFEKGRVKIIPFKSVNSKEKNILELMAASCSLNEDFFLPTQWNEVYSDSEWILKSNDAYYVIPPIISMLGLYDKIGKALNWVDFGPEIETAVLDLFRGVPGLKEYSGKYEFEEKVYECDAIVIGTEYALIIECKRKGLSRTARGGDGLKVAEDIAASYFSSQAQAYRMQRAIEAREGRIEFLPTECRVSNKQFQNEMYDECKEIAIFTTVKHFIRISCTGGNFWIASEVGIADHIERHIQKYKVKEKYEPFIKEFISERDKMLARKTCEVEKKIIKMDRLFLSFDKLYDIVMRLKRTTEGGDDLLRGIWKLTRTQSKKLDSTNHLEMLMACHKQPT